MQNNKKTIFLLIFFTTLLSPIFIIPSVQSAEVQDMDDLNTSQMLSDPIKIAIYDDANTTRPSYTAVGILTNNYSLIESILLGAGYEVSIITTDQIYNHELLTANYDVFIMADNLPKERITNHVKEFWLDGGSLLTFDSVAAYLCWSGIIPPISEGSDGYSVYWNNQDQSSAIINLRHPATKSYNIGDTFSFGSTYQWSTFDWTALMGTTIAGDLYRLAYQPGDLNDVTVLGFDPSNRGGKVVHFLTFDDLEADDLIIDAVEWLCPKPKAKILFDLAHNPYYGIDAWDEPTDYTPRLETFRDNLVNRSYTLDKWHSSTSGNLTQSVLAHYDLLIINAPSINFTSSEVAVVTNWIDDGGNMLVLGLRSTSWPNIAGNINFLLSSFDLKINMTDAGTAVVDYQTEHPTMEGCNQLDCSYSSPGLINYEGSAVPLWGNNINDIIIGAQEYGEGRIILSGDLFFLRESYITLQDNLQYAINMVNWLTASDAEVLIVIGDHFNPDPNDNVYKGPVATALNELGINFYLTFTCSYFNLSLVNYDWDLVIVDEVVNIGYIDNYASEIINYMDNGGHLLIWSYREQYSSPLWDYLGYSPEGSELVTPPVIYIWDTDNAIFNTPVQYGANNFTTSLNPFGTDFVNVTLHNNATGIAGLTSTSTVDSNAIILSVNGRAISNTFGLSEYYDDTDDSTYPDGLEIWTNEIAYMWAKINPTSQAGIPGYDLFIFLSSFFLTLGLIATITIRKKKLL